MPSFGAVFSRRSGDDATHDALVNGTLMHSRINGAAGLSQRTVHTYAYGRPVLDPSSIGHPLLSTLNTKRGISIVESGSSDNTVAKRQKTSDRMYMTRANATDVKEKFIEPFAMDVVKLMASGSCTESSCKEIIKKYTFSDKDADVDATFTNIDENADDGHTDKLVYSLSGIDESERDFVVTFMQFMAWHHLVLDKNDTSSRFWWYVFRGIWRYRAKLAGFICPGFIVMKGLEKEDSARKPWIFKPGRIKNDALKAVIMASVAADSTAAPNAQGSGTAAPNAQGSGTAAPNAQDAGTEAPRGQGRDAHNQNIPSPPPQTPQDHTNQDGVSEDRNSTEDTLDQNYNPMTVYLIRKLFLGKPGSPEMTTDFQGKTGGILIFTSEKISYTLFSAVENGYHLTVLNIREAIVGDDSVHTVLDVPRKYNVFRAKIAKWPIFNFPLAFDDKSVFKEISMKMYFDGTNDTKKYGPILRLEEYRDLYRVNGLRKTVWFRKINNETLIGSLILDGLFEPVFLMSLFEMYTLVVIAGDTVVIDMAALREIVYIVETRLNKGTQAVQTHMLTNIIIRGWEEAIERAPEAYLWDSALETIPVSSQNVNAIRRLWRGGPKTARLVREQMVSTALNALTETVSVDQPINSTLGVSVMANVLAAYTMTNRGMAPYINTAKPFFVSGETDAILDYVWGIAGRVNVHSRNAMWMFNEDPSTAAVYIASGHTSLEAFIGLVGHGAAHRARQKIHTLWYSVLTLFGYIRSSADGTEDLRYAQSTVSGYLSFLFLQEDMNAAAEIVESKLCTLSKIFALPRYTFPVDTALAEDTTEPPNMPLQLKESLTVEPLDNIRISSYHVTAGMSLLRTLVMTARVALYGVDTFTERGEHAAQVWHQNMIMRFPWEHMYGNAAYDALEVGRLAGLLSELTSGVTTAIAPAAGSPTTTAAAGSVETVVPTLWQRVCGLAYGAFVRGGLGRVALAAAKPFVSSRAGSPHVVRTVDCSHLNVYSKTVPTYDAAYTYFDLLNTCVDVLDKWAVRCALTNALSNVNGTAVNFDALLDPDHARRTTEAPSSRRDRAAAAIAVGGLTMIKWAQSNSRNAPQVDKKHGAAIAAIYRHAITVVREASQNTVINDVATHLTESGYTYTADIAAPASTDLLRVSGLSGINEYSPTWVRTLVESSLLNLVPLAITVGLRVPHCAYGVDAQDVLVSLAYAAMVTHLEIPRVLPLEFGELIARLDELPFGLRAVVRMDRALVGAARAALRLVPGLWRVRLPVADILSAVRSGPVTAAGAAVRAVSNEIATLLIGSTRLFTWKRSPYIIAVTAALCAAKFAESKYETFKGRVPLGYGELLPDVEFLTMDAVVALLKAHPYLSLYIAAVLYITMRTEGTAARRRHAALTDRLTRARLEAPVATPPDVPEPVVTFVTTLATFVTLMAETLRDPANTDHRFDADRAFELAAHMATEAPECVPLRGAVAGLLALDVATVKEILATAEADSGARPVVLPPALLDAENSLQIAEHHVADILRAETAAIVPESKPAPAQASGALSAPLSVGARPEEQGGPPPKRPRFSYDLPPPTAPKYLSFLHHFEYAHRYRRDHMQHPAPQPPTVAKDLRLTGIALESEWLCKLCAVLMAPVLQHGSEGDAAFFAQAMAALVRDPRWVPVGRREGKRATVYALLELIVETPPAPAPATAPDAHAFWALYRIFGTDPLVRSLPHAQDIALTLPSADFDHAFVDALTDRAVRNPREISAGAPLMTLLDRMAACWYAPPPGADPEVVLRLIGAYVTSMVERWYRGLPPGGGVTLADIIGLTDDALARLVFAARGDLMAAFAGSAACISYHAFIVACTHFEVRNPGVYEGPAGLRALVARAADAEVVPQPRPVSLKLYLEAAPPPEGRDDVAHADVYAARVLVPVASLSHAMETVEAAAGYALHFGRHRWPQSVVALCRAWLSLRNSSATAALEAVTFVVVSGDRSGWTARAVADVLLASARHTLQRLNWRGAVAASLPLLLQASTEAGSGADLGLFRDTWAAVAHAAAAAGVDTGGLDADGMRGAVDAFLLTATLGASATLAPTPYVAALVNAVALGGAVDGRDFRGDLVAAVACNPAVGGDTIPMHEVFRRMHRPADDPATTALFDATLRMLLYGTSAVIAAGGGAPIEQRIGRPVRADATVRLFDDMLTESEYLQTLSDAHPGPSPAVASSVIAFLCRYLNWAPSNDLRAPFDAADLARITHAASGNSGVLVFLMCHTPSAPAVRHAMLTRLIEYALAVDCAALVEALAVKREVYRAVNANPAIDKSPFSEPQLAALEALLGRTPAPRRGDARDRPAKRDAMLALCRFHNEDATYMGAATSTAMCLFVVRMCMVLSEEEDAPPLLMPNTLMRMCNDAYSDADARDNDLNETLRIVRLQHNYGVLKALYHSDVDVKERIVPYIGDIGNAAMDKWVWSCMQCFAYKYDTAFFEALISNVGHYETDLDMSIVEFIPFKPDFFTHKNQHLFFMLCDNMDVGVLRRSVLRVCTYLSDSMYARVLGMGEFVADAVEAPLSAELIASTGDYIVRHTPRPISDIEDAVCVVVFVLRHPREAGYDSFNDMLPEALAYLFKKREPLKDYIQRLYRTFWLPREVDLDALPAPLSRAGWPYEAPLGESGRYLYMMLSQEGFLSYVLPPGPAAGGRTACSDARWPPWLTDVVLECVADGVAPWLCANAFYYLVLYFGVGRLFEVFSGVEGDGAAAVPQLLRIANQYYVEWHKNPAIMNLTVYMDTQNATEAVFADVKAEIERRAKMRFDPVVPTDMRVRCITCMEWFPLSDVSAFKEARGAVRFEYACTAHCMPGYARMRRRIFAHQQYRGYESGVNAWRRLCKAAADILRAHGRGAAGVETAEAGVQRTLRDLAELTAADGGALAQDSKERETLLIVERTIRAWLERDAPDAALGWGLAAADRSAAHSIAARLMEASMHGASSTRLRVTAQSLQKAHSRAALTAALCLLTDRVCAPDCPAAERRHYHATLARFPWGGATGDAAVWRDASLARVAAQQCGCPGSSTPERDPHAVHWVLASLLRAEPHVPITGLLPPHVTALMAEYDALCPRAAARDIAPRLSADLQVCAAHYVLSRSGAAGGLPEEWRAHTGLAQALVAAAGQSAPETVPALVQAQWMAADAVPSDVWARSLTALLEQRRWAEAAPLLEKGSSNGTGGGAGTLVAAVAPEVRGQALADCIADGGTQDGAAALGVLCALARAPDTPVEDGLRALLKHPHRASLHMAMELRKAGHDLGALAQRAQMRCGGGGSSIAYPPRTAVSYGDVARRLGALKDHRGGALLSRATVEAIEQRFRTPRALEAGTDALLSRARGVDLGRVLEVCCNADTPEAEHVAADLVEAVAARGSAAMMVGLLRKFRQVAPVCGADAVALAAVAVAHNPAHGAFEALAAHRPSVLTPAEWERVVAGPIVGNRALWALEAFIGHAPSASVEAVRSDEHLLDTLATEWPQAHAALARTAPRRPTLQSLCAQMPGNALLERLQTALGSPETDRVRAIYDVLTSGPEHRRLPTDVARIIMIHAIPPSMWGELFRTASRESADVVKKLTRFLAMQMTGDEDEQRAAVPDSVIVEIVKAFIEVGRTDYAMMYLKKRPTVDLVELEGTFETAMARGCRTCFRMFSVTQSFTKLLRSIEELDINKIRSTAAKCGVYVRAHNDRALHEATKLRPDAFIEVATILLDACANIHSRKDHAFVTFTKRSELSALDFLLRRGANIDAQGGAPLIVAVRNGKRDVAQYLLAHKANIHVRSDLPLVYACASGNAAMVALLLEYGANAKEPRASGHAIRQGHDSIVKMLFDHGATIGGLTYISFVEAAADGHLDVVRLLLDRGIDVARIGHTALKYASKAGHAAVARLLLERGANVHAEDEIALMTAVRAGHADVVAELVAGGADVHVKDDRPLRMAAHYGNVDIVAALIRGGADVRNAAALASARNHPAVLDLLQRAAERLTQSANAPLDGRMYNDLAYTSAPPLRIRAVKAASKSPPLSAYARAERPSGGHRGGFTASALRTRRAKRAAAVSLTSGTAEASVERASAAAPSVGTRRLDGRSTFYTLRNVDQYLVMSALSSDADGIRNAIAAGADVHVMGDRPLYEVLKHKRYSEAAALVLLENGANPNNRPEFNPEDFLNDTWTIFESAVYKADIDVIKLLLRNRADVHANDGRALSVAALREDVSVIRCLLDHGARVNDGNGGAFIDACAHGNEAVINLLLQSGADIEAQDGGPLRKASALGVYNTVKMLLDHGARVNAGNGGALVAAAGQGHHEHIVKLLLEAGADVHAQDDAAIKAASAKRDAATVKTLLKHGADANKALAPACEHSEATGIVQLALDHGADVNYNNGVALRTAVTHSCEETVRLLLEAGADTNVGERAPLWTAVAKGEDDIAELLLENGADVHAKNGEAMCKASEGGDTDMMRLLLHYGADVNAQDGAPMCSAAYYGHLEAVILLFNNGGDVHANRDEPILKAAESGAVAVVEFLLENGVDVDANGGEALQVAIAKGHRAVVEVLKRAIVAKAAATAREAAGDTASAPKMLSMREFTVWCHALEHPRLALPPPRGVASRRDGRRLIARVVCGEDDPAAQACTRADIAHMRALLEDTRSDPGADVHKAIAIITRFATGLARRALAERICGDRCRFAFGLHHMRMLRALGAALVAAQKFDGNLMLAYMNMPRLLADRVFRPSYAQLAQDLSGEDGLEFLAPEERGDADAHQSAAAPPEGDSDDGADADDLALVGNRYLVPDVFESYDAIPRDWPRVPGTDRPHFYYTCPVTSVAYERADAFVVLTDQSPVGPEPPPARVVRLLSCDAMIGILSVNTSVQFSYRSGGPHNGVAFKDPLTNAPNPSVYLFAQWRRFNPQALVKGGSGNRYEAPALLERRVRNAATLDSKRPREDGDGGGDGGDRKRVTVQMVHDFIIDASHGRLEDVVSWVNKGVDVNTVNGAALVSASKGGHLNVVEFLVQNGANVHINDNEPILLAASAGQVEVVKFLVEHGVDVNFDVSRGALLENAVFSGNIKMVMYLLERGIDIHARNDSALVEAANCGYAEIINILLDHGADVHVSGDSPMRAASIRGNMAAVEALMRRGADVNVGAGVPLRAALNGGHLATAECLLNNGADVHADDDAALCKASKYGKRDIVELLIRYGANINAQDGEPIVSAAENGCADVVDILLKHGANVCVRNYAVIYISAKGGCVDILRVLVRHGIDIHINDNMALRSAAQHGHESTVEYLLGCGADMHAKNDEAVQSALDGTHYEVLKKFVLSGLDIHYQNDVMLLSAVNYGRLHDVKWFIDHGADVHAKDDLAIAEASKHGDDVMVKFLLERGARAQADDNRALVVAAEKGRNACVTLLIEKGGANIHARNECALRTSAKRGHLAVVKTLIAHGADVLADNKAALREAQQEGHTEVVRCIESHIEKQRHASIRLASIQDFTVWCRAIEHPRLALPSVSAASRRDAQRLLIDVVCGNRDDAAQECRRTDVEHMRAILSDRSGGARDAQRAIRVIQAFSSDAARRSLALRICDPSSRFAFRLHHMRMLRALGAALGGTDLMLAYMNMPKMLVGSVYTPSLSALSNDISENGTVSYVPEGDSGNVEPYQSGADIPFESSGTSDDIEDDLTLIDNSCIVPDIFESYSAIPRDWPRVPGTDTPQFYYTCPVTSVEYDCAAAFVVMTPQDPLDMDPEPARTVTLLSRSALYDMLTAASLDVRQSYIEGTRSNEAVFKNPVTNEANPSVYLFAQWRRFNPQARIVGGSGNKYEAPALLERRVKGGSSRRRPQARS